MKRYYCARDARRMVNSTRARVVMKQLGPAVKAYRRLHARRHVRKMGVKTSAKQKMPVG